VTTIIAYFDACFGAKNGQQVNGNAWPLESYLELGAFPTAVPCARLHSRQVMNEWRLEALAGPVELVVSELVTNGTGRGR
jgi:hypothetical protein